MAIDFKYLHWCQKLMETCLVLGIKNVFEIEGVINS